MPENIQNTGADAGAYANIDADNAALADTLADTLASLKRQLAAADDALMETTGERRAYIAGLVEKKLLPTISGNVYAQLQRQVPQFVSAAVEGAFEEHRKLFGIFPRSGTRQALMMLRTSLASYVDRTKFGEIATYDQRLQQQADDKKLLASAMQEAIALTALVQQAQAGHVAPAESVIDRIQRLAALRKIVPRAVRRSSPERDDTPAWSDRSSSSSASSSAAAPMQGGGGSFDGGGASGNWNVAGQTAGATGTGTAAATFAAAAGAGIVAAGIASDLAAQVADGQTDAGGGAITTDDSLGRFS